ncbi:MAG TPA: hypothetical protein VHW00_14980 [Thermoanaerobaculia bacterium]|nr:hypothetical protein [Thermoanaerobaculia bacterium]
MVEYDKYVILEFAERLYDQAKRLVLAYVAGSLLMGVAIGFAIGTMIQNVWTSTLVAAGICCVVGVSLAQQKAFALRLQAQTALCQVEIESNTRRASGN